MIQIEQKKRPKVVQEIHDPNGFIAASRRKNVPKGVKSVDEHGCTVYTETYADGSTSTSGCTAPLQRPAKVVETVTFAARIGDDAEETTITIRKTQLLGLLAKAAELSIQQ